MLLVNRISLKGILLFSLCLTLLLPACSTLQPSGSDSDQTSSSSTAMPPFFPSGVKDIQIPADLELRRDDSMFINTASYNGGILSYEGRVEIESLADYFTSTMKKNGWKLAGSVRYKNVLLAFVKPNKSCIIKILETNLTWKTQTYIYYTEDLQNRESTGYMMDEGGMR